MSTNRPARPDHVDAEAHAHPQPGAPDSPLAALNRRDFMRVSGTLAAAGAITASGCQPPAETSLPFHQRPEGLRSLGQTQHYATVLDGAPVLVRVREGRPILIAPSPNAPGHRSLSARHHAALLDLYDPDRAAGPLAILRAAEQTAASDWSVISNGVVKVLKQRQGDVVLLTPPLRGPATRALVDELQRSLGLHHVEYSPLGDEARLRVWRAAFPASAPPRPRLDRADLVVGLGAEFIDQPTDGLEMDFARRRDPTAAEGLSRFVQLEGRASLTGANADQRIRVRDSQLGAVAAALAHAVIVEQHHGPLAQDPAVAQALAGFAPDAMASATGVSAEVVRALARDLIRAGRRGLVLAGGTASASASGLLLESAVLLLNHSLSGFGAELFEAGASPPTSDDGPGRLAALAVNLKAGKVRALIVAGCNPVYDAPADVDFAAAMDKVQLVVSLGDRVDETAAHADFLAPTSHPLEAWGDDALGRSAAALQQPVIRPLYDTFGLLDVLVAWGAAAGAGGPVQEAAALAQAQVGKPLLSATTSAGYHYVKAHWLKHLVATESAWDQALRQGFIERPGLVPLFAGADSQQAWADALAPASAPGELPAAASRPASDAAAGEEKRAPTHAAARFGVLGTPRAGDPDLVEAGLLSLLPPASPDPALLALLQPPAGAPAELELQLYPHHALRDGRSGNNGWLHELPDPITRLTWGGALSVAPRRFDEMGLEDGDLVELAVNGRTVQVPAYRHAGMHQDVLALPLGLGRSRAGAIGSDIGVNAFALQAVVDGRALRAGLPATLRRVSGHVVLAGAQGADVIDRQARPLVPVTTLSAFRQNPASGTEQTPGGPSAWPEHPYDKQRWGMVIDLARCNGCGHCVIGCQAENNIPVVGAKNIVDGREMSWLRIDRYYDAPPREGGWDDGVWSGPLAVVEEPVTLFQPMLCQHCENAPCETVCPFNATMHSEDGLNQQIYNRCVGTRYCANNCPFKVRRYNWFEYSQPRSSRLYKLLFPELEHHAILNVRGRMQMKNNPEVTVRSRGVMEKCSFCVQRIREARAAAIRDGHKGQLADGAVVPACMEVCPTGAIVFGDLNDPASRVSQLVRSPRAMRLLESIGVKPSVYYLSKVRHDVA